MKKTINNLEIETFVTTLLLPDSFVKTMRMPFVARQAIRVNSQLLIKKYQEYQEERKNILEKAVQNGFAQRLNNGEYAISKEHSEVTKKLQDLMEKKIDLEIKCFDINQLLNNNLTLAEEDILLFFREE